MNEDGITCISGAKIISSNDFIDIEEDDLNHGHGDELERTGDSNDNTK